MGNKSAPWLYLLSGERRRQVIEEMRCYIVTFETESTESLNQIVDALKFYGTYCPVNLSCWAIKIDEGASIR